MLQWPTPQAASSLRCDAEMCLRNEKTLLKLRFNANINHQRVQSNVYACVAIILLTSPSSSSSHRCCDKPIRRTLFPHIQHPQSRSLCVVTQPPPKFHHKIVYQYEPSVGTSAGKLLSAQINYPGQIFAKRLKHFQSPAPRLRCAVRLRPCLRRVFRRRRSLDVLNTQTQCVHKRRRNSTQLGCWLAGADAVAAFRCCCAYRMKNVHFGMPRCKWKVCRRRRRRPNVHGRRSGTRNERRLCGNSTLTISGCTALESVANKSLNFNMLGRIHTDGNGGVYIRKYKIKNYIYSSIH